MRFYKFVIEPSDAVHLPPKAFASGNNPYILEFVQPYQLVYLYDHVSFLHKKYNKNYSKLKHIFVNITIFPL